MGWTRSHVYAVALILLALLTAGSAAALRVPGAANCPVFPKSNPWNRPVDSLPVAANSRELIRSMGQGTALHPDFGSGTWDGGPIGIPFNVVGKKTPRVKLTFDYADESDKGPYPIPRNVKLEYGGDRHALMLDRASCPSSATGRRARSTRTTPSRCASRRRRPTGSSTSSTATATTPV